MDDAELLSIPTEQLDIVITKKETKMGPSVENAQPIEIANESGINHSSGCYFRDNPDANRTRLSATNLEIWYLMKRCGTHVTFELFLVPS